MDFDLFNNPWSPGGQMHSQSPYAHQWQDYGWGHGNEYFRPKTKQDIRKEALLQLAVLAAVVVAPMVIGALGSAGGAAAAGAGGGAAGGGAAAAGTAVEAAALGAGPLAAGGGAAAAAGGSAAAAGGVSAGAVAAAALTAQALQPFLQPGALDAVSQAAFRGAEALNQQLQQPPQQRPSFVYEPGGYGAEIDPADLLQASQAAAQPKTRKHRGMNVLRRLTEELERSRPLQRALEIARVKGSNVLSQKAVMQLANFVQDELGQVENPWEVGEFENALQEQMKEDDRDDEKGPQSYVVFPKSFKGDSVLESVYYDAKKQDGWKILKVTGVQELAKKLEGKEVDNLLFVSHGATIYSSFKIGNEEITKEESSLKKLIALNTTKANNVILFSCMAGRISPLRGEGEPFGGDKVLGALANILEANAFGNQGWSFPSEANLRGLNHVSIFNRASDIQFVISGLHPTNGPRISEASKWLLGYWEGAGKWTLVDPTGNITELDRALYLLNDGQFSFTNYSWRDHKYVKPFIDYFYQRIDDPGMSHQQRVYGAREASPNFRP